MATEQDRMERIVSLAKRRGFIFPSSEIYGGINGFWDYGPLGVALKRNIKDAWWHDVVRCPPAGPDGKPIEMVGLDCSIIMNPKVWEASGHVGGFNDPMVDDKETKQRFRADQLFGLFPIPDPSSPDFPQIAVQYIMQRTPDGTPRVQVYGVLVAGSLSEAVNILEKDPTALMYDRSRLGRLKRVVPAKPNVQPQVDAYVKADFGKVGSTHALVTQVPRSYLQDFIEYVPSPATGKTGSLTEPRQFNLMFKTFAGASEDSSSETYLRPETAQGIFANYMNVLDTSRVKVPFGIAQIGKAFRNEINPRNYTFRSREFEQMEIEFFCHPNDADTWYTYWRDARFQWYVDHGLKSERLRLRDHEKDELAHYAAACADIEYAFPFGASELEGVANRTDFDLKQHQNHPACVVKDLSYFDDGTKERYIPYVIEPSGGVDRAALAFLCEAYEEDEAPDDKGVMRKRTVLRFHPRFAPIKVAVFPLVRKDGMPEKAREIYMACREQVTAFYDEKGAVGRRYRRQDEAGTPFCVTVDGQTAEDGTVTIRERDTMVQERIAADDVAAYVRERLRL